MPPEKLKVWEPKKKLFMEQMGSSLIQSYESAFKNRLQSWFMRGKSNSDLPKFLEEVTDGVKELIRKSLNSYTSVKVNIVVECSLKNINGEEKNVALKTRNKPIYKDTDLGEVIKSFVEKIKSEMEESQLQKSGWTLKSIDGVRLRINKNNPMKGSTYIRLPTEIEKKKACINVKNRDKKCFMYSILAKCVSEHPQRVSKYENLDHVYNFDCISYPTPLHEIKRFEKVNNISINVFSLEKHNKLYPLKVVKEELPDHRDLLLISNDSGASHYVYIKNFERLVRNQMTKHREAIAICKRCFSKFDSQHGKNKEEKLKEHSEYCGENKAVRIELPVKKPYVEFERVERALRVPYVIYADFESLLEPVHQPSGTVTIACQRHTPMSYCLYVKEADEVANIPSLLPKEPIIYRGKDAASNFVKHLKVIAEEVSRLYSLNTPMIPLTDEEEAEFQRTNFCYVCEKLIGEEIKVRDHCHITGQYRGPAHNSCNLRCQNPNFLPVFIHNLSGYDGHFIVKELGYDEQEIEVIPNSEEKYISFTKRINGQIKVRYLDSFRFMPASLDSLVKNVPFLKETSKFYAGEALSLMKRKGVFPYEYITSWDRLDATSLPPREAFYNTLTRSHVSEDDYAHANKVWNYFNFKTLGEYSDHYLKTDVLLLSDVFENFREGVLKNYIIDPCHYYTTPGVSWDSALKKTGVRLELLTDYDMILMIERGIRGGICQASYRYAEANNRFMDKYDVNQDSTFITYQDCNNLYGTVMTLPLPYGGFKWVEKPEDVDVLSLSEDDETGYILQISADYPHHLHRLHNDIPFLAESITPPGGKHKKLIPHLNNRKNYVVHYMALKQALEHGLKLTKIHRVLEFKQSRWLSSYINFNTELRKRATNNFEKDLFKLMNNAVFGKTMENIRNRMNLKLVSDHKQLEKMIAKPGFLDRTVYSENLAAVHMMKTTTVFDKPIYVGMAILDLSKTIMYNYHYDVMLPKYGPDRIKLMYMDTDSFIYLIKTGDIFNDFYELLEYMDTSDYPPTHKCYSSVNKKVLGKFKDEMNGVLIKSFIALRAKMYAVRVGNEEIKKIKGVSKNVIKKDIHFEDYLTCLKSDIIMRKKMHVIQSKHHNISTCEVDKIALSSNDDKRLILPDGVSTHAHGFIGENLTVSQIKSEGLLL